MVIRQLCHMGPGTATDPAVIHRRLEAAEAGLADQAAVAQRAELGRQRALGAGRGQGETAVEGVRKVRGHVRRDGLRRPGPGCVDECDQGVPPAVHEGVDVDLIHAAENPGVESNHNLHEGRRGRECGTNGSGVGPILHVGIIA